MEGGRGREIVRKKEGEEEGSRQEGRSVPVDVYDLDLGDPQKHVEDLRVCKEEIR